MSPCPPAPVRVEPHPDADNPVLTAADVDDVSHVSFVADPFVVRTGGRYHLFFEVKSRERRSLLGLGDTSPAFDVAHATSEDGLDWTYEGVVLPSAQAEHTYPFVFRHGGTWYMTPSPAGTTPDEFRVYRGDPFPDEWTVVDRALTGEVRIDPTPFRYGDRWYLQYQEAGSYDVRLRYADSLLDGEWREHPASPLFTPGGNDIAPGGRPLVYETHVDVFFRRGTPGIVEHWRMTDLGPDRVEMRELDASPIVAGTGGRDWNGQNMHHVDAGTTRGPGDPVVVDGQDGEGSYRIGVYARER